jgi:hypothetical protein
MTEPFRELDPVFGEEWMIRYKCPCCEKCRLIVKSKQRRVGTCVYGGPYKGYVVVERAL